MLTDLSQCTQEDTAHHALSKDRQGAAAVPLSLTARTHTCYPRLPYSRGGRETTTSQPPSNKMADTNQLNTIRTYYIEVVTFKIGDYMTQARFTNHPLLKLLRTIVLEGGSCFVPHLLIV